mmetsp:Transcript_107795/g.168367  ORF Transcript_107795/g.168367 Transcript_107795/m.168367 type:complete len:279 (-) Transcript_107795:47-883(-)
MEDPVRRNSPTPSNTSSNRRGQMVRGTMVRGPGVRTGRLSSCRSPDSSTPTPSCPSSPRTTFSSITPSVGKVSAAPTPARQGLRGTHAQIGAASSRATSPQGVVSATERAQSRLPRRSATAAPAVGAASCDASMFVAGSRSSGAAIPRSGGSRTMMGPPSTSSASGHSGSRHFRGHSVGTRVGACGKATLTPSTPMAQSSKSVRRDLDVVLTAKLASRLLADLLEAYRGTEKLEDARAAVGKAWGFEDAAQMDRCIEAQANASYCCAASTAGDLNECS